MKNWCFLFCHLVHVTPTHFHHFCPSLPGFEPLPPIVCTSTNSFLEGCPQAWNTSSTGRDPQQLGVCFPRAIPSQWLFPPRAKVIHIHQTWRHSSCSSSLVGSGCCCLMWDLAWVIYLLWFPPLSASQTLFDPLCNLFLVNHLYPVFISVSLSRNRIWDLKYGLPFFVF